MEPDAPYILPMLLSGSIMRKMYLPKAKSTPVKIPPLTATFQVGLPLVKNLNNTVNQTVTMLIKRT